MLGDLKTNKTAYYDFSVDVIFPDKLYKYLALSFLKDFFRTQLSDAKIEAGTLNGPQTRQLLGCSELSDLLTPIQKRAFEGIRDVCNNFLGNNRAENYKKIVAEMLTAFKEMKVNMSLKIHFMYSHLSFFPDNCGDYSDEQGERFHQDIAVIEKRFKCKNSAHMLGEYCWSICRDTDPNQHKRKSDRQFFLTM
ncbi:uncharacterized protein LOC129574472 [Sitodiplosis mosellana]|uniref:uncharacterized protein LOC129574472 n=1 Tax=Sitodiplosis mosellana TaxID=263140 RepID=UPI0024441348|nr:uncharacterized protein LOC129574472 [Sitodiplosis mosellana]